MKVTIYADSMDDVDLAKRILKREIEKFPDRSKRQRKRDGTIWASEVPRALPWRAVVWGGPDHYRIDCRSATFE